MSPRSRGLSFSPVNESLAGIFGLVSPNHPSGVKDQIYLSTSTPQSELEVDYHSSEQSSKSWSLTSLTLSSFLSLSSNNCKSNMKNLHSLRKPGDSPTAQSRRPKLSSLSSYTEDIMQLPVSNKEEQSSHSDWNKKTSKKNTVRFNSFFNSMNKSLYLWIICICCFGGASIIFAQQCLDADVKEDMSSFSTEEVSDSGSTTSDTASTLGVQNLAQKKKNSLKLINSTSSKTLTKKKRALAILGEKKIVYVPGGAYHGPANLRKDRKINLSTSLLSEIDSAEIFLKDADDHMGSDLLTFYTSNSGGSNSGGPGKKNSWSFPLRWLNGASMDSQNGWMTVSHTREEAEKEVSENNFNKEQEVSTVTSSKKTLIKNQQRFKTYLAPSRFEVSHSFTPAELIRSEKKASQYRQNVRQEMSDCWRLYKEHSGFFDHDEYRPISGFAEDWIHLGVFGLDSIDTLYLMGLKEEFDEFKGFLEKQSSFNWIERAASAFHSTFEISIRALGGLLGAYTLSGDEIFLERAAVLGNRMLFAYNKKSSNVEHMKENKKKVENYFGKSNKKTTLTNSELLNLTRSFMGPPLEFRAKSLHDFSFHPGWVGEGGMDDEFYESKDALQTGSLLPGNAVNLKSGERWTSATASLSESGSIQLEFRVLSAEVYDWNRKRKMKELDKFKRKSEANLAKSAKANSKESNTSSDTTRSRSSKVDSSADDKIQMIRNDDNVITTSRPPVSVLSRTLNSLNSTFLGTYTNSDGKSLKLLNSDKNSMNQGELNSETELNSLSPTELKHIQSHSIGLLSSNPSLFYDLPDRSLAHIVQQSNKIGRGLVPDVISETEGFRKGTRFNIGGKSDSYYEYLLKLYLLAQGPSVLEQGVDHFNEGFNELVKNPGIKLDDKYTYLIKNPENLNFNLADHGGKESVEQLKEKSFQSSSSGRGIGYLTSNPSLKALWVQAMEEMIKELLVASDYSEHWFLVERSKSGDKLKPNMEHLTCFVPGMLVLAVMEFGIEDLNDISLVAEGEDHAEAVRRGQSQSGESGPSNSVRVNLSNLDYMKRRWLRVAEKLMATCVEMYFSMKTGLSPDAAIITRGEDGGNNEDSGSAPGAGDNSFLGESSPKKGLSPAPGAEFNLLRPETIESLFYLHYLTGNPIYREWGYMIWESFMRFSRTPKGFGEVKNVDILPKNMVFGWDNYLKDSPDSDGLSTKLGPFHHPKNKGKSISTTYSDDVVNGVKVQTTVIKKTGLHEVSREEIDEMDSDWDTPPLTTKSSTLPSQNTVNTLDTLLYVPDVKKIFPVVNQKELSYKLSQNVKPHQKFTGGPGDEKEDQAGDSHDLKDVHIADHWQSFFMAETLKYFFLLFSPYEEVRGLMEKYILSTEAHFFRRGSGRRLI